MDAKLEKIAKRYKGIQDLMRELKWSDSCLFLCLCTIIEEVTDKPVDMAWLTRMAVDNGFMDKEFYIRNSIGILEAATGKRFTRDVYSPEEFEKIKTAFPSDWYSIEVWQKGNGKHFRRRFVDTLSDSQTVKNGKLKEYYVYKGSNS